MKLNSLVPMAYVHSEAGPIRHPFYARRGEFRVTDPDGHVVMVTHT